MTAPGAPADPHAREAPSDDTAVDELLAMLPAMRPLVQAARWRVGLVGVLAVLLALLPAIGADVPTRTMLGVCAWLAVTLLVLVAVHRLRERGEARLVRAVSAVGFAMDGAAELFVSLQLGGGAWMAESLLVFSSFALNATLPRRWALPLTAYAAALAVAVPFAAAAGASGGGVAVDAPALGSYGQAALTAALGAALVVCASAMQQALLFDMRRSGARHRLVLESATDMIFTLDRALHFETSNLAMLRDSGYERDALLGRPFADLLTSDDAPRVLARLDLAVAGAAQRFDTRYRRRDGALRWLAVTVSPIRERHATLGVLAIARDVTDVRAAEEHRARLQAQLAQAQKMDAVVQLVSGVAHELNNPLTAVLTFTEELLAEPRRGSDEQALRTVWEQARRARAIVRDLRAFVRETDGDDARALPADVVARVVRGAGKAARDASAALTVEVAPDAPAADVPVAAFEQVVANLVLNAVSAVDAAGGGHVVVQVRGADDSLELVVEDDGAGIDASVAPHIFEPFFTTRATGQGSGLGLSVSLGIVEQYGGTMAFATRPAVAGTRFTVRLPAMSPRDVLPRITGEQPAQRPASVARMAPPESAEGAAAPVAPPARRVLVVDDESSIRLALRRFFTRRGWQVDDVGNARDALERLVDAGPDSYSVILSDLKMPGLSGPEFYHELARCAPHWLDRLILSTGDVASPDAAAFLAQARCPVLEKPFELAVLAAAVESVYARVVAEAASAA